MCCKVSCVSGGNAISACRAGAKLHVAPKNIKFAGQWHKKAMNQLKAYISLLRVPQWAKNLLVLAPVFFDHGFGRQGALCHALTAMVAFCLAASAVYCLNDVVDRKADSQHPVKCRRPVASGAVSVASALVLMAVCVALSVIVSASVGHGVLVLVVCYLAANVAYSLALKRLALLDVMVVAMFYVARIWCGSLASNVNPTAWIMVMTFLLALFLAFAKRRDDVAIKESGKSGVRATVSNYNIDFVNMGLTLIATVTVAAYIMYAISPEVTSRFGTQFVVVTALPVLAGVLRYMQLTLVESRSGSPTAVLFHDRPVQLCIALWVALWVVIIYC